MSRLCRFCPKEIWGEVIDGKTMYFDDPTKTIPHVHNGVGRSTKCIDDHRLLATTITRVSNLEREIEILKKKILGDHVNATS